MKWYKVYWGTWGNGGVISHYDFGNYSYGTYSRDQAFQAAEEVASRLGVKVTVREEYCGRVIFYEVER